MNLAGTLWAQQVPMASIRKKRGKWHVQVRRKGFKAVSRTFITKADAQAWARQTEVEADKGHLIPDAKSLENMTLAGLVIRYRDTVTIKRLSI